MQSRKFEDKNGNTRTAFEVIVTDFDFCEKKGGADVNMSVDPLDAFKDNLAKNNVPTGKTDFEEIIDDSDDLPF